MTEPTKGTWLYRTQSHGTTVESVDGVDVAWCGENWSSLHGAIPHVANARLIAAAPDLLTALEKAKETIAYWHGSIGLDLYQQSPEMQDINAAISKAKGEVTTLDNPTATV